MFTEPALDSDESPVARRRSPELPELLNPLIMSVLPELPTNFASDVRIEIDPEELLSLLPLSSDTSPPTPEVLEPAIILTDPPESPALLPAKIVTLPLGPVLAFPVEMETSPELPWSALPDSIATAPLRPPESEFGALPIDTPPLTLETLTPLRRLTEPPVVPVLSPAAI
jgi:hypothetical protein